MANAGILPRLHHEDIRAYPEEFCIQSLLEGNRFFGSFPFIVWYEFYLEDGSDMLLRNVFWISKEYKGLCPRRQNSSY
jgi:hypothetical protein